MKDQLKTILNIETEFDKNKSVCRSSSYLRSSLYWGPKH